MGRDPKVGRVYSLLGRQNLCFSTIIVICGSPNCVLSSFVGRQLLNVENHCSKVIPLIYNLRLLLTDIEAPEKFVKATFFTKNVSFLNHAISLVLIIIFYS